MNAIPVIRLGKVSKRKIVIEVAISSVASVSVRSVSRRALLNSVNRHARKIRMNWMGNLKAKKNQQKSRRIRKSEARLQNRRMKKLHL